MSLPPDVQNELDKINSSTQKKKAVVVKLCLILSSLSILTYLSFASLAPFKNNFFSTLYPKTPSQASTLGQPPQVDLKASYKGAITEGPVNASSKELVNLTWTTSGNITSCTARAWGQLAAASSWAGAKDPKGGSLNLKLPTAAGSYVYTLDCTGPLGDADGDSITINIDGQNRLNSPYLVDFQASFQNKSLDLNNPTDVPIGQKVNVNWSTLNTATPYSICISSGSWPNKYLRQTNIRGNDEFTITERKIYKYTVYCSNEHGFTRKTITINGV